VREEGNYLRPAVDIGGAFFVGFYQKWNLPTGKQPAEHFADLLLTPSAIDTSLKDYADGFFNLANAACLILGQEDLARQRAPRACIGKLKALAGLGDPDLRRAACGYLESQFEEKCGQ
jgi:hypothetical protein